MFLKRGLTIQNEQFQCFKVTYLHRSYLSNRHIVPVPADRKVSGRSLKQKQINVTAFLIFESLITSPSHEKLTRSPSVLFWFNGGFVMTAPPEQINYRHSLEAPPVQPPQLQYYPGQKALPPINFNITFNSGPVYTTPYFEVIELLN